MKIPKLFPAPVKALMGCALAAICAAVSPAHAGDILRGGATAQTPGTVPVYGATAATTAAGRTYANDTLARTTQAMQAFQAMQQAARNAALASGANNLGADPNHPGLQLPNVPNGLVTGGLVPDSGLSAPGTANPVTTWSGASTPVQTTAGGQTTVTVTQTLQQALLNWKTFNIGAKTTLNIDQSAGGANVNNWIAFNIINDPSGIPSQILGSINAPGQVYVINQNGIIFGGASQVNTHTLVASSLPINTNLVSLGLLNNPDDQFLFSQLPINQGANGTPAFSPPAPNTPSGLDGDVTVQAGAQLSAPTNAENVGGRIALIGPNVTNAGTISTPDGQTILAAGNQVGFAAHSSNDPSLRGLDVYVGSVDSTSGNATNSGVIEAARGAVTITGKSVNQLGGIDSTTSVALNGRIDLLADYNDITSGGAANVQPFLPTSTGAVTLGPGSVTQILPETDSSDTVVGTQLALSSLVNIQGLTIYMAPNATLLAPGASLPSNTSQPALGIDGLALDSGVTLNAGVWLSNSISSAINPGSGESFVHSGGQVYLDTGATIEVGGSEDVAASVSQNIVTVQLRGAELANSPLQRDGVLRGQSVNVDITQSGIYNGVAWVGTPLANVSGYAALVERTVGELTTNGGSVSISAGNSVVMQPGSTVDVSGGWINYQGAMVNTTQLLSGGHIYDISQATPNLVYQGILGQFTADYSKWGVTENFDSLLVGQPYYEPGYIQGGAGGSITVTAPSMALDGNLLGNTVAGPRQRAIAPGLSMLSIVFQSQDPSNAGFQAVSPTPPAITFSAVSGLPAVPAFAVDGSGNPMPLPTKRITDVTLSPALLTTDGFGSLNVNDSDGDITVPVNVALTTQVGGAITLSGENIDIQGQVVSPGGALSFTVNLFSPYADLTSSATVDPALGHFTLDAGASLSTAGLLVNDLPGSAAPYSLSLVGNTNGGTVTINSYDVDLSPGSSINVSGGASISETSKGTLAITYGKGGAITIDSSHVTIDSNTKQFAGGQLELGATLLGYSGGTGGSLSILAPLVQIGGVQAAPGELYLPAGFFDTGGFTSFNISALGAATSQAFQFVPAVDIEPGTVITPQAAGYVATPAGGQDGYALVPILEPQGVRSPVSLAFNALGLSDPFGTINPVTGSTLDVRGDFIMGTGAAIITDPQTNAAKGVSISGQTVALLGSIIAPGGSITIKGGQDSGSLFLNGALSALPTVDIGPQAVLSVAGAVVLTPDPTDHGYTNGSVLPGGSISISGNIVAEAGSVINVSGATGVLDLPPAESGQSAPAGGGFSGYLEIPTEVDSNAGSITFSGASELFTDATLLGRAGGPSAVGGMLSLNSGVYGASGNSPLIPNLVVTQSGITIPVPFYTSGQTAIGNAVVDSHGNAIAGKGYFAADQFNNGGFYSLVLQNTVQFSGPVNITANGSLTVATGGGIFADNAVTLTAPYVALGQPFTTPLQVVQQPLTVFQNGADPFTFAPLYGPGSLTVNANLIDIGNLSLQGIGNANFYAINGDIRGDGTLDVAGNILMVAGQVYPPTEQSFTIVAYDHGGTPGSVTFQSAGTRQLPLSAGGTFNVYASIINQGGVLRAPMGTINLGWDGSGATPVDQITGSGLVDSNGNSIATITITPTRQLTLSNGSITSVSAIDPVTGQGLVIPYGINVNGTQWIDPAGNDITTTTTASGVPSKLINISAVNVTDAPGATIDLRGGGDLYAYRFVSGTGGSTDILSSNSSFAVLPGYQADYAPYAPYNPSPPSGNLGGDLGYVNSNLAVGDRIYLSGGDGLAAGYYTLLPARYALLSGAYLVTPSSVQTPAVATVNPDGSVIMPGYQMSIGQAGRQLYSSFEVDSQAVVQARAEYDNFSANSFLSQTAIANGVAVPRLPVDSGQLVLQATQSMALLGVFHSGAASGGLSGLVDIDSSQDILINSTGVDNAFNGLVLGASNLTAIGAESLLIGGIRETGANGTTVTVDTGNITVDNQGTPLAGSDVILVANNSITLAPGAAINATGALTDAESLQLGNSATPGSGNGTLLRVSSDASAQTARAGVLSTSTAQQMVIGAGASITGASVTLDSTYATSLDPAATINGSAINLDSGQISIQLDNPGTVPPIPGLMLSGLALQDLQASAHALSLLSYSSIDIYGTGQVGGSADAQGNFPVASLALHAAEIRGFNNGGGTVTFNAGDILLDNSPVGSVPVRSLPATPTAGTALVFNANVIDIGVSQLSVDQFSGQLAAQAGSQPSNNQFNLDQNIDQYAQVTLNASEGVLALGTIRNPVAQSLQGAVVTNVLNTQGALTISTPMITGVTGAHQTFAAAGALNITDPVAAATISGGLGANLAFQGSSVTVNTNVVLPSGILTLDATGGDLNVAGGRLDVSGQVETFFDLTEYTDGGQINLISATGAVSIAANAVIDVSAQPGGGDAGTLSISVPANVFSVDQNASLLGHGGAGGNNGTFILDAGNISGGSLGTLASVLSTGGFTQSVSIRDRKDASITVDGTMTAQSFTLSADAGSILVTGTIDASGITGGTIDLAANGNLTLAAGSKLTAAGAYYNNAGQGGSITLEAGDETNGTAGNGYVDIQPGSDIELGVTNRLTTSDLALGITNDIRTDLVAGTLHLRAPQTSGSTDVQIDAISGTINGASSIVVEGYAIFNASADGSIDNQEANVLADGNTFVGAKGSASASFAAMQSRLFSANPSLESIAIIEPGAEIINPNGDLTLASNWDLSTYRFGTANVAGDLVLRAAGNLVFDFDASLSDGFQKVGKHGNLWTAQLQAVGSQSWSYRLVAGADFSAADFRQVQPLSVLVRKNTGSLLLGYGSPALPTTAVADRADVIPNYFQTIRTGVGSIDIAAGQDVQLLNPIATIYTAGSQAPAMANFDTPDLNYLSSDYPAQTPTYVASFSMNGGNITITAQNNIAHYIASGSNLLASSSLELPNNWLYRQGWVDPTTGQFGAPQGDGNIASTAWWVDFSNFFEGVGALGGGNVTMIAGNNILNVDAVVPTNARMPIGTPSASALLELGGGDLLVRAGGNVSGGAYYVERGQGVIQAGNDIFTNSTRAALSETTLSEDQASNIIPNSTTWLPTTLFLGEGSFNISANGDVLLGPVANPFLLPQGINNSFLERTYFSTYVASDAVDVMSLDGNVTIKNGAIAASLDTWYESMGLIFQDATSFASNSEPWLGLAETGIPSATALDLMPATLRATAFTGDINLVGGVTLDPSPIGTIDLAAAGSINGVQPTAVNNVTGANEWASSIINLSDANPNSIPGVADPASFGANSIAINWTFTDPSILAPFDLLFNDSGSTDGVFGVLQTKEALHAPGLLHANDPDPVHIYADSGDISGITLFSPKVTKVSAGEDVTDVALYIQNDNASDVSLVTAGRDIIPYDPNSALRIDAQEGNNQLFQFIIGTDSPGTGAPNAGDIQVSGPGTIEVLAGRNLDLGIGPNNADGTGLGITSIGNAANPYLPFAGAAIITGAGIGNSQGLDNSQLGFANFISAFLDPSTAGAESSRYLPDLGLLMGMSGASNTQVWDDFKLLSSKQQDILALDIFYLVLRDAGRDHNDASSAGFGNYNEGYAAIADLFPGNSWQGDVSLTSREIKTESGGDVDIFAPGGDLNVGLQVAGTQAVDQGILTEDGGNINIFTRNSVNVGTSRIFTLRGGNEIIWSSYGNIAAGASSKTVQSAPPTRVLVDPQSGNVQTDLAGLATGGGIGVLATVVGVPVGDVDLIAPAGTVDAGDAGIRATGNLNIAATQILNASNIQVGGASTGTPVAAAAPNVGNFTNASNANGATNSAANDVARGNSNGNNSQPVVQDSDINVEVIGYGGGDGEQSFNDDPRKKKPGSRQQNPQAYNDNAAFVSGAHLAGNSPALEEQKK